MDFNTLFYYNEDDELLNIEIDKKLLDRTYYVKEQYYRIDSELVYPQKNVFFILNNADFFEENNRLKHCINLSNTFLNFNINYQPKKRYSVDGISRLNELNPYIFLACDYFLLFDTNCNISGIISKSRGKQYYNYLSLSIYKDTNFIGISKHYTPLNLQKYFLNKIINNFPAEILFKINKIFPKFYFIQKYL